MANTVLEELNAFVNSNTASTMHTPFDIHTDDGVVEGMYYPGRNPNAPRTASYARIRNLMGLNTLEVTYAFEESLMDRFSDTLEALLENENVDAVIMPDLVNQMHYGPLKAQLIQYGWTFEENYDIYILTKESLRQHKAQRIHSAKRAPYAVKAMRQKTQKNVDASLSEHVGRFLLRKGDVGGRRKRTKRLRVKVRR